MQGQLCLWLGLLSIEGHLHLFGEASCHSEDILRLVVLSNTCLITPGKDSKPSGSIYRTLFVDLELLYAELESKASGRPRHEVINTPHSET